jgi:hypothetical protein
MPVAWSVPEEVIMHRIHLIGRSSAAVTAQDAAAAVTIAEGPARWTAMLTTFFLAVLPGLQVAQDSPTGLPRGHILAAVAYLVLAAAVSAWGGWRGWRMRPRLDDHGVTIRNFFRIYQFGWPEVRQFADGSVNGGNAGHLWALSVVLSDGRVVTATATARGKRDARPQTPAAIRQAAERYTIPADLSRPATKPGSPESPANPGSYPDPGCQPGSRHWNGSAWSPFLQPDPPGRGPEEGKAPGELWSPLPGSEPQWQDAASRASRAGIWLAVWLAVTAAAMIVTVLLYTQDLSEPQAGFTAAAWALIAAAFGLLRTYGAWQQRKSLTKIDQARRTAGLADTGELVSADRVTRWRPR